MVVVSEPSRCSGSPLRGRLASRNHLATLRAAHGCVQLKKKTRLDYRDGLQFQCQACGKCCLTRGKYSFVYVSLAERRRLAVLRKMSTRVFTLRYCVKTDGAFHLRDNGLACVFARGARCLVYMARPEQCRTWPFWPENMFRNSWRDIGKACPGIGRGTRHTREAIKLTLRHDRLWAGRV